MSEPSSLFVKVQILPEQLTKFKNSRPVAPALNSSWTSWWDSREMYNPSALQAIQAYHAASYGRVIADFIEEKFSGAREHYDPKTHTWTFYVLQFSENYQEILPMLALLKDLAQYLEPESSGTAILYDFLWENSELMFEVQYLNREAKLTHAKRTGQLPSTTIQEADAELSLWRDELSKRYED